MDTLASGPLVIVGGADKPQQVDIYRSFIELCPPVVQPSLQSWNTPAPLGRTEQKTIGVISTASSEPQISFLKIRDRLLAAGAQEVLHIPLSATDSTLHGNEDKQETVDLIEGCQGIWFTGGDQRLTLTCLKREGNRETPALQALRNIQSRGGVLGGTSAGAAIMSDPMIYGGTSLGCLGGVAGQEQLELGPGLGFFPHGLVDQHFDARGRLIRLARSLEHTHHTMGYGVCENTAMVVTGNKIGVRGASGVYVIQTNPGGPYPFELSYLEVGDEFFPFQGEWNFPDKTSTWGDENLDAPRPLATGVLSPHGNLRDFIGRELLDNTYENLWKDGELGYVRSFLVGDTGSGDPGDSLRGYELRFYHKPSTSRGYYNDKGSISFTGVGFSFHPLTLSPVLL